MTISQSRAIDPGCIWMLLPAWIVLSAVAYFTGGIMRTDALVLDAVFGLALLALGVYATWQQRRFPAATLTFDAPPIPGNDFNATITAPLIEDPSIRIVLDSWPNRRTHRLLWETTTRGELTLRVHIPKDLAHQLDRTCSWTVELRGRAGRWPYLAKFIIRDA